jgi:hypothetical protein
MHKSSTRETVQNMEAKINLIIEDGLRDKIKYLCNKIYEVEWSGILFYSVQGSIKDPENMLLTAVDILPMDQGNSTFTEYTLDDRFTDYLMEDPARMDLNIGHMHSHHNMDVFFSGTDQAELHENAAAHNFYLSVIVNNHGDVTAKVATKGSVKATNVNVPVECLDEKGEPYQMKNIDLDIDKNFIFEYKCDIQMNPYKIDVPDSFAKRVAGLMKSQSRPTVKRYGGSSDNDVIGFSRTYNQPVSPHEEFFGISEEEEEEVDTDFDFEEILIWLLATVHVKLDSNAKLSDLKTELPINLLNRFKVNPVRVAKMISMAAPTYKKNFCEEITMGEFLDGLIDEVAYYKGNKYAKAINDILVTMLNQIA